MFFSDDSGVLEVSGEVEEQQQVEQVNDVSTDIDTLLEPYFCDPTDSVLDEIISSTAFDDDIISSLLNHRYEELDFHLPQRNENLILENIDSSKTRRKRKLVEDSSASSFAQYQNAYDSGDLMDCTTRMGILFRKRFRIPWSMFLEIYEETKPDWERYNQMHPFSVKLLVYLRWLATGATFDQLQELSNIGEETCRIFCMDFGLYFALKYKSKYIKLPTTSSEIQHVMGLYEINGLPGCMGSVDGGKHQYH